MCKHVYIPIIPYTIYPPSDPENNYLAPLRKWIQTPEEMKESVERGVRSRGERGGERSSMSPDTPSTTPAVIVVAPKLGG